MHYHTPQFSAPSSGPVLTLVNETSSTSISLEWILPDEETHNGIIRSYRVTLTEEETGRELIYDTEDTFKSISSLHPHYLYICEVQAFTVSYGPPSEPAYIMTMEDGKFDNS